MDPRLEWQRYEKNGELLESIYNEDFENPAFNFFAEIPGKETFSLQLRCECAKKDCTDRLPIKLGQFRRVHKTPNRFCIHPEHVVSEIEDVVDNCGDFVIVEKKKGFRPSDFTPDASAALDL